MKTELPSKKSVFIKKCADSELKGNEFRFNFEDQGSEAVREEMSHFRGEEANSKSDFHYTPSDNSFRFGFSASD